MNVASKEEARALALQDPFVINGVRSFRIWEWTVMEGSFGIQVNYSDRSIEIKMRGRRRERNIKQGCHGHHWFHRCRQDRSSDLRASSQKRLPRAGLSPRLTGRFTKKLGGVAAKSPAQVGAQTDIVFTCLPSDAALEEVVSGPNGLVHSARPDMQIVVEFGSHSIPVKEKYIAPLAAEGAIFLDGEVSGTPGMVAQARKSAIYIAGDQIAAQKIEPVIKSFADLYLYPRCLRFAATKVKLIGNNLLVRACTSPARRRRWRSGCSRASTPR